MSKILLEVVARIIFYSCIIITLVSTVLSFTRGNMFMAVLSFSNVAYFIFIYLIDFRRSIVKLTDKEKSSSKTQIGPIKKFIILLSSFSTSDGNLEKQIIIGIIPTIPLLIWIIYEQLTNPFIHQ